jgi:S1-C subfamily serine protease
MIATSVISGIIATTLVTNPLKMTPPKLFNRVSPAVVTVTSYSLDRDVFEHGRLKTSPMGIGSGFILKNKGNPVIVTNGHVINDAAQVVITYKGQEFPAVLVSVDGIRDVALLKIEGELGELDISTKTHLELCTQDPFIGESVAAIGNPFGLDKSMSIGIISGIGRNIEGSPNQQAIINMLQTDAAINPGNSGGPLVDMQKGCVIGMNTAMISPGVGFAIPAQDIKDSIDVIINKKPRLERLGIELMPDPLIEQLGLPGLAIINIVPGSIAEEIGLKGTYRDAQGMPHFGDIILTVNSTPVKFSKDLKSILNNPPQTLQLEILRDGNKSTVVLKTQR